MLTALLITVAVSTADIPFTQLEQYYWDCDTAFMAGELGGQDMMSCLAITEEFQDYFPSRESFMQYWEEQRRTQWYQRGYSWPAVKD